MMGVLLQKAYRYIVLPSILSLVVGLRVLCRYLTTQQKTNPSIPLDAHSPPFHFILFQLTRTHELLVPVSSVHGEVLVSSMPAEHSVLTDLSLSRPISLVKLHEHEIYCCPPVETRPTAVLQ